MREFFKGWKRKIGVLMLAFPCIFMAGWVRSYNDQTDRCRLLGGILESTNGGIERWEHHNWQEIRREISDESGAVVDVVNEIHVDLSLVWRIPYWSIVIPLTALCAWLFLSKPRPATNPPTEPDHA
jgi:hypothetical protein